MIILGAFKGLIDSGEIPFFEKDGVSYVSIPRKGEASCVMIPLGAVGKLVSGMDLSEESSAIMITEEPEATSFLAAEFGVLAGTKSNPNVLDCNILFVDGGVILTINDGKALIKIRDEDEEKVYVIDHDGELDLASSSVISRATWVDTNNLRRSCEGYSALKFGLGKDPKVSASLVDNMVVRTIFTYTPPGSGVTLEQASYILGTRFLEFYGDIGLGQYEIPGSAPAQSAYSSDFDSEEEDPDFDLSAEVDEDVQDLLNDESDDEEDFETIGGDEDEEAV